jgi:hypothetical protein
MPKLKKWRPPWAWLMGILRNIGSAASRFGRGAGGAVSGAYKGMHGSLQPLVSRLGRSGAANRVGAGTGKQLPASLYTSQRTMASATAPTAPSGWQQAMSGAGNAAKRYMELRSQLGPGVSATPTEDRPASWGPGVETPPILESPVTRVTQMPRRGRDEEDYLPWYMTMGRARARGR